LWKNLLKTKLEFYSIYSFFLAVQGIIGQKT
jgi:hypothetical protein